MKKEKYGYVFFSLGLSFTNCQKNTNTFFYLLEIYKSVGDGSPFFIDKEQKEQKQFLKFSIFLPGEL